MHRLWAIPCLFLLASCNGAEQEAAPVDHEQIERLSIPKIETPPDPLAGARLQPITESDLQQAGLSGSGCAFRSGPVLLVVASSSDSIARVGGSLLHLAASEPAGPSGVFLEDRSISISIGRRESAAAGAVQALPARAKVTNRRTGAQIELNGAWTCAG